MCGPKFCSMKISQEVREVAKESAKEAEMEAEQKTTKQEAQKVHQEKTQGMQEMAKAFNDSGAELYHSADKTVG